MTESGTSVDKLDKLLARVDNEAAIRHVTDQQHGIDHVKDVEMLHAAAEAVENQKEISLEYTIANTDRACGAMLSGVIAAKYGEKGLPEHTLNVKFKGSAGQSFGALPCPGCQLQAGRRHLVGDNKLLRQFVKKDHPMSIILYGPPGCGKTTMAKASLMI